MTNLQKSVLNLVKRNASITEIKEILGIDDYRLIRTLKSLEDNGYAALKEYYASGDVRLNLKKDKEPEKIKIEGVKNHFKIGVVADSHLGSDRERPDYIDMAANYFESRGIHYVLHGGDFIDGLGKSRFKTLEGEANYALKRYPKANDVTTFVTLGDHDKQPLIDEGYNFGKRMENKRLDLVPIGIGYGEIGVGNETIAILHKITKKKKSNYESRIILLAHGHKSCCELEEDHLRVRVPPISDIIIGEVAPGFLVLYLDLNNQDEILRATVRRMVFADRPLVANEDIFQFKKK